MGDETTNVPPERDVNKSEKAMIFSNLAKHLPHRTPLGVIDEIRQWEVVVMSPFSSSLYDITNKNWGQRPNGHLRISNHWNFHIRGQIHAPADKVFKKKRWAMGRYDVCSGMYQIVKVWDPV